MDKKTLHRVVRELIDQKEHAAAYRVVERHCARDRQFIEGVIRRFVKAGDSVSVQRDNYFHAWSYLKFPVSPKVCELVLAAFLSHGYFRQARDIALRSLGRNLTETEVKAVVAHYCQNMAVSSPDEEIELERIAEEVGGGMLLDWAHGAIVDFRRRWAELPDC